VGKSYGHQIPYTPMHSGSATFSLENRWVNFNYILYFNGKRYTLQQNIPENILYPYVDQNISLSHKFMIQKHFIDVQLSVNNIFNVQYEIIHNFPMQGRSFGCRVIYGFN
ncbi:TonB-dependent receptor, partial [Bacteroidales bacterium OttesenSCG-928-A14]|nr:TonB-dependent receptor [Bacteroidales bacterium OttesenSCG-928-A14]